MLGTSHPGSFPDIPSTAVGAATPSRVYDAEPGRGAPGGSCTGFSRRGLVALLALAALLFTAAATAQPIQIITLPTGSMAYRAGVTLAAALTRHTGRPAIVAGYGGAQVIVPMLQAGRAELALINSSDALSGYRGTDPFRRASPDLRLVSNAYSIAAGVIVAEDSPIRSLEDIRGRRVTGAFSSHKSCELLAEAQMANIGLGWDDVQVVPVTNPVGSIQALAEGRADVALCVAPGIPALLEADAKIGIRYLSLDPSDAAVTRLKQVFNMGAIVLKDKKEIANLDEDAYFLVYDYYLVGSTRVSDEVVQAVLQILWDRHEILFKENKDFRTWTRDRMLTPDHAIPYHEAAIKFFRERGKRLPR